MRDRIYKRPQWYAFWITFLAIGVGLLIFLTIDAKAHPLPKGSSVPALHLICKAVGKCTDTVPRPLTNCGHADDGRQEEIFDPLLKRYVTWECYCPSGWPESDCGWRRIAISHHWTLFPAPEPVRRFVWDRQRRCPSIVCKARTVKHYYPTLFAMGGRL